MKKIVLLTICIVIFCAPILAYENGGERFRMDALVPGITYSIERDAVKSELDRLDTNRIRESSISIASMTDRDTGNYSGLWIDRDSLYKLFRIDSYDLSYQYDNVDDMIDNYTIPLWIVPIKNDENEFVSMQTIAFIQEKWQPAVFNLVYRTDHLIMTDYEQILKLLNDNDIKKFKSIIPLHLFDLDIVCLYVMADEGNKVVIVYNREDSFIDVKNLKSYPEDVFMKIVKDYNGEPDGLLKGAGPGDINLPPRQVKNPVVQPKTDIAEALEYDNIDANNADKPPLNALLIIMPIAAAIITLALVFGLKKKKRQ